MPACAAVNCKNRQFKGCGRTFHLFPFSRPQVLAVWLANMKRDRWTPTRRSVICCDHFEAECFDLTGQTTRLKQDAVPTIFQFPSHLKKITKPQRKPPKERTFVHPTSNVEAANTTATPKLSTSSAINYHHCYAVPQCTATLKRRLDVALDQISYLQKKVKTLQQKSRRLSKKVTLQCNTMR
ncbi:THAP domain-containing protein 1-like [Thalassophryne amazonica]|uniref:THAP domain-containing protein 1-like n=1 Tax=Thalassophryne amazonica TaxID=390379 RepID=UPI001471A4A1|nr:THAP domain-containing protein 1-like [Thalassophryne amazonica]